jgi:hypothetical protein
MLYPMTVSRLTKLTACEAIQDYEAQAYLPERSCGGRRKEEGKEGAKAQGREEKIEGGDQR